MAGYKRTQRIHLEFEGEFEGLEIAVGKPSIEDMLIIRKFQSNLGNDKDPQKEEESIRQLCALMGRNIKEWNLLDDDDQPVKPSAEALLSFDIDFIMAVLTAWTNASVGVPAPLDGSSPSGETSLEASLPMETVSPSLLS